VIGTKRSKRAKPERYVAFMSYSHAESQQATTLHGWLERFFVPADLRNRINGQTRLYPVFRDEAEFAASNDLGELIRASLDKSDALIVLCTVRSAASRWVEEEVRHFLTSRPGLPVICVLMGLERDQLPSLLPAPLRERFERGDEPLAVDMRGPLEQKHTQRLRIAAALLRIGYDELARRDKARRTRSWVMYFLRTAPLAALGGFVAILMVVFALFAGLSGQGMALNDYSSVAHAACNEVLEIGPAAARIARSKDSDIAALGRSVQVSASKTFEICEHKEMYYFSAPPEDWQIPEWVVRAR
jgi:hypothetical protein